MKINKLLWVQGFFFSFCWVASAATIEKTKVVTFDGQQLNGVFTLPDGKVLGSALILQGSGDVDLSGDVSGPMLGEGYHGQSAKLSEQLALRLAENGVASLRYSKRGFDDLTQLPNQTIPFLVKDAHSGLDFMKLRFPGVKAGVVGLSEGALVGTLLSGEIKLDALFLLSIPTREIDDLLGYQFFSWPTELMIKHFDQTQAGFLDNQMLQGKGLKALPLMGAPLAIADLNHDGKISVKDELLPTYQNFYQTMRTLLETPAYASWYQSLKALPPFSVTASRVQAEMIYIYQGLDDAQVRWNWVLEDSYAFTVKPSIRLFPHVGHCFSPMEGEWGELKTTGPLSDDLLDQLMNDVRLGLHLR